MQLFPHDNPYDWLDSDSEWDCYFENKAYDLEHMSIKKPIKALTEFKELDEYLQDGIYTKFTDEFKELLKKYDTDKCKEYLKNDYVYQILGVYDFDEVYRILQMLFKNYQYRCDFRYADFTEVARYLIDK
jgi:hypothetical protein